MTLGNVAPVRPEQAPARLVACIDAAAATAAFDAAASMGQDLAMGCLLALLALAVPRLTLVVLWLFTTRLSEAVDSFLLGVLGFLVLPYTTVLFALAYHAPDGVSGLGWFLVAFGFLVDLGVHRNSGRFGKRS